MTEMQWAIWFWLAVVIGGAFLGGYLLMKLFRYQIRHLAQKVAKSPALDRATLDWIEEISHGIRLAVIALAGLLIIFFSLRLIRHPAVAGWDITRLLEWLMDRGVRLTLLLAGAYVTAKVVHMFLGKLGVLIRPSDDSPAAQMERDKRAQTISAILKNFASAVIAVVAGLMVLQELGVNITPILTSLGVVGVALGFGAQQLVGDLIAGFFLIFENQIRVGDVAVINGTGGLVEEIRLRTTVLRGQDGTVHTFRNGSIHTLANMTKDYSYFLLDLGVSYQEDIDRVCAVVREVAAGMQSESPFAAFILEPVEILGVENFSDTAVILRLRIKTIPLKQWDVGREFRRRLKYAFDAQGIELPFPQRTVYFAEAGKPFAASRKTPDGGESSSQPS
ncbi:MAG TPA: mechanosensitive ion channel family protein [Terriglobia bacterium]|nr:mechanosensitive ion channel family protein [Terriglobia bacterium]